MVEKKKKIIKKASVKKTAVKAKSSITKKKVIAKTTPQKSSNQSLIMSIILGIFIIISAFQSFQINSLKTQIETGGVKITSSSESSYTSSGNSGKSAVPSSIQDLPDMVGGC